MDNLIPFFASVPISPRRIGFRTAAARPRYFALPPVRGGGVAEEEATPPPIVMTLLPSPPVGWIIAIIAGW